MPEVWIELTHPDAKMPIRATKGSACFDLYACEDAIVEYGSVTIVDVGLKVQVPKGYELVVRPRSGMAFKHGITVVNSPGTIDSDYRGPVKVALTSINWAHAKRWDIQFKINKGDRVAQVALQKVPSWDFLEHEVEDNTSRGAGGFGSTGK